MMTTKRTPRLDRGTVQLVTPREPDRRHTVVARDTDGASVTLGFVEHRTHRAPRGWLALNPITLTPIRRTVLGKRKVSSSDVWPSRKAAIEALTDRWEQQR